MNYLLIVLVYHIHNPDTRPFTANALAERPASIGAMWHVDSLKTCKEKGTEFISDFNTTMANNRSPMRAESFSCLPDQSKDDSTEYSSGSASAAIGAYSHEEK
jgi:hypothetical protein